MLLLKSIASEDRSIVPPVKGSYLMSKRTLYFHCASGFSTQILAYMLDSLVRVSRRVKEHHFVKIANMTYSRTLQYHATTPAGTCPPSIGTQHDRQPSKCACYRSSVQSKVAVPGYNSSGEPTFLTPFSPEPNRS